MPERFKVVFYTMQGAIQVICFTFKDTAYLSVNNYNNYNELPVLRLHWRFAKLLQILSNDDVLKAKKVGTSAALRPLSISAV